MKRLTALLLVLGLTLCVFAGAVQAQTGIIGKGVKVGINFATWKGSDAKINGALNFMDTEISGSGPDMRTGFAAGLYLRYGIGTNVYLQPEVLYTMKGAKYTATVTDPLLGSVDADITTKFDYIEVPILLKYAFTSTSTITPNLSVGPAIAFKTSSKVKAEVFGIGGSADVPMVKSTDFGICFGGGLDFAMGKSAMALDVRYTMGLSRVMDVPIVNPNIKNSAFTVSAGYAF